MTITTTPTIEGRKVVKYKGIIAGEAILGADVVRDIFASITNIIGGRSTEYEEELNKARKIALSEIEEEAKKLGANAIIGVDIDYEAPVQGMLMVTASGTAVVLEDKVEDES